MEHVVEFSIRLRSADDYMTAREHLEARSTIAKDPLGTDYYFVSGSEKDLEDVLRWRNEEPNRYPWTCLISFEEGSIGVNQEPSDEGALRVVRDFVRWILDNFDCKILDDYGNDLTSACRKDVHFLYQGRLPEPP